MEAIDIASEKTIPFFDRPTVHTETIQIGGGIPFGYEQVTNPIVGIGGVYGTWGQCYDNEALPKLVEERTGSPIQPSEHMNLAELGFDLRHHVPDMTDAEYEEVEVEVGARFLSEAAKANGWLPSEVDAVMIGISAPVCPDFIEKIAAKAGILPKALKVSIHKACDGSVGGLHLALNPNLPDLYGFTRNLGQELFGKKVLIGGLEGLSHYLRESRDHYAHQLFGNAAGIIGVIPGRTMKFLVGKMDEVFDQEGVLKVRMTYPYSGRSSGGPGTNVEVTETAPNSLRFAGRMHEPEDGSSVEMAGPMGMVKLFVRSGVQVVKDAYASYLDLMERMGTPTKSFRVVIVHHANYKINKLKEKNLLKEGIRLNMPWVVSDFGNVSAASNMIAFLRNLKSLAPRDHVLFDGFGAGTYYDVVAVEMGSAESA